MFFHKIHQPLDDPTHLKTTKPSSSVMGHGCTTSPPQAEQYFIQVALKIDVKHSQVAKRRGAAFQPVLQRVVGMGNLPMITDMLNGKWLERGWRVRSKLIDTFLNSGHEWILKLTEPNRYACFLDVGVNSQTGLCPIVTCEVFLLATEQGSGDTSYLHKRIRNPTWGSKESPEKGKIQNHWKSHECQ